MKTLMLLLLAIFLCAHPIHAGLSPYEQKKLLDELNFDRRDVGKKLGLKFGKLTYNTTLEKLFDTTETCGFSLGRGGPTVIPLEYDSVARDFFKKAGENHDQGSVKGFFNLDSYSIGCSKDYECSHKLGDHPDIPKEFYGKTIEYRGACVTNSQLYSQSPENIKIANSGLPDVWKYGKIIGVKQFDQ